MPTDFTYNNGSTPATKTNLTPLPGGADATKYIQDQDVNLLTAAVNSLRSAILAGQYYGLGNNASAPVSGPNAIQMASINGQLQVSENGAAYGLVGKPEVQAYTASTGALTPAVARSRHMPVSLDANLTINNPSLSAGAVVANGGVGTLLTFLFTQDSTGFRTVSFGTNFKDVSNWMPRQGAGQRSSISFSLQSDGTWAPLIKDGIDLSKPLNPLDWGAVGSSAAVDTAAFQAIFARLSANAGISKPAASGSIHQPAGYQFYINATLTCIGDPGAGVIWQGELGTDRALSVGSSLKWVGASDGVMIHWRGMNGSQVRNISFDGGALAKTCFWASEFYPHGGEAGVYTGSSGLFFYDCIFGNPRAAATSVPFAVGLDDGSTQNLQASEYRWYNCFFTGNGSGPGLAGCYIQSPGNTKNFSFYLCSFLEVDFGIYQPAGSGDTTVVDCQFADIGWNQDGCSVYMGSGENLTILGFQSENSNTGYRAKALFCDNDFPVVVKGGYIAGNAPSNDIIVSTGSCPAIIEGVNFEQNSRAGSNVLKISGENLQVRSNHFGVNTTRITYAPVYDGGGSNLFGDDTYRGNPALPARCIIEGNDYVLLGTDNVWQHLTDVRMRAALVLRGAPSEQTSLGVPSGITLEEESGKTRITIPYTVFQTAALTKDFRIGQLQDGTRVLDVTSRINTPFAGTAGSLNLTVGPESGGVVTDHWLLAHDATASAGTTKGFVDGDLGADLAAATRPHARGPAYSPAQFFRIQLVSGSGNLSGLTAGSVTITICYDYLGA